MVELERREPQPGSSTDRPSPARLILLSFLMLFVELGLIRWSGAYVVYLAFFTNFVLLASFLGVGVGFLRARARGDLFRYLPGVARGARPVPRRLPGRGRSRRGSAAVRRSLRVAGPAQVALARRRLPPRVPDHGRDRGGRGSDLRAVRTARGVSVGHPRQHPRDRRVLRPLVPRSIAARLGRDRRGDLRRRGATGRIRSSCRWRQRSSSSGSSRSPRTPDGRPTTG